jgi:hypothetical protein
MLTRRGKVNLEDLLTLFIDQEGVFLPFRSIKSVIVSFGCRTLQYKSGDYPACRHHYSMRSTCQNKVGYSAR